MRVNEGGERRGQCLRRFFARLSQHVGGAIRRLNLLQPSRNAERHPPNVLDESEAEHGGNRPQLAHAERRDRLILAHEQRDVVEIEVALGMRYQLDGHFVGARITGKGAGSELGQLFVVALGKICPDLPYVLLDDIEVVEEPVARRTDVETALGAGVELVVHPVEDVSGILEPKQQRCYAALFLGRKKVVPARDCARSLAKSLRAQHFATNRTDEFFAGTVARTAEQTT